MTAYLHSTTPDQDSAEWRDSYGRLHRLDGPAVIYANGTRMWYIDGDLHRSDGPAVEWADGDREWYVHGELSRDDGPAITNRTGSHWLRGRSYYPTDVGEAVVAASREHSVPLELAWAVADALGQDTDPAAIRAAIVEALT